MSVWSRTLPLTANCFSPLPGLSITSKEFMVVKLGLKWSILFSFCDYNHCIGNAAKYCCPHWSYTTGKRKIRNNMKEN